jgi:hypothetical protein
MTVRPGNLPTCNAAQRGRVLHAAPPPSTSSRHPNRCRDPSRHRRGIGPPVPDRLRQVVRHRGDQARPRGSHSCPRHRRRDPRSATTAQRCQRRPQRHSEEHRPRHRSGPQESTDKCPGAALLSGLTRDPEARGWYPGTARRRGSLKGTQLVAAAGNPKDVADLATVLFATGGRLGEIAALRWCDFNPAPGIVMISSTLTALAGRGTVREERTKTGGSTRLVPLVRWAHRALLRRARRFETNLDAAAAMPIFGSQLPTHWRTMRQRARRGTPRRRPARQRPAGPSCAAWRHGGRRRLGNHRIGGGLMGWTGGGRRRVSE